MPGRRSGIAKRRIGLIESLLRVRVEGQLTYNTTAQPFMTFLKSAEAKAAFKSAGVSADLRRQLTETKIEPAAEGPAPLPPVRQAEATSARSTKNKRAQVDR
jgi:hypothetical protein